MTQKITLPLVKKSQRIALAAEKNCLFPPGHFYSPVPDLDAVRKDSKRIFDFGSQALPGINLQEERQRKLLVQFQEFYDAIPWLDEKIAGRRYHFKNPAYSYTDAIFLYSMIRNFSPKRIIEIGSGYSSCVTLDTNEIFYDNAIACTFIEPFPKLLRSLMLPDDSERVAIIESRVQDVPLELYDSLQDGDILFVDSTHVSKTGSDVNHIFFNILPRLRRGVLIHFHDIFFPFEYPQKWVMEGRGWNESYMLRTFLQFNESFEIQLFANYLAEYEREFLLSLLPRCTGNLGGNIWLQRVA